MPRPRAKKVGPETDDVVMPLARGLDILRAFRPEDGYLRNQDMAQRTGLPRPTVSRLTGTLVALGYLDYDRGTGRYGLAPAVVGLGYACLTNIAARKRLRPAMQSLADRTNAAVALGGRDRLDMIYLESCRGNSPVPLRFDVGSHLPIMLTAIGRAYLAALDEAQFASAMSDIRAAAQADWPRIKSGIERAREDVRRHGFCVSIGEWEEGLNAVGAPVVSPRGVILALNCGAPSFLLDPDRLRSDIGPQLAIIAQTASKVPEGDDAAAKA